MYDRVAAEVESVIEGKAMDCLDDADLTALAKLPFVAACVKETLRLYNTAVGAPRLAARDTQLGEHFVPAGTICISDIYCLHRNEVQIHFAFNLTFVSVTSTAFIGMRCKFIAVFILHLYFAYLTIHHCSE